MPLLQPGILQVEGGHTGTAHSGASGAVCGPLGRLSGRSGHSIRGMGIVPRDCTVIVRNCPSCAFLMLQLLRYGPADGRNGHSFRSGWCRRKQRHMAASSLALLSLAAQATASLATSRRVVAVAPVVHFALAGGDW